MLTALVRSALDLVFPLTCLGCRREGSVICPACLAGLKRLECPYCDICARPRTPGICARCSQETPAIDSIRAPFLFEGTLRDAISQLKYRGMRAAAKPLAELLAEYMRSRMPDADVLVPVPLHPRRLRQRGYNQSALLAQELSSLLELPVEQDLLVRVQNSQPQVDTLSREERRANVAGVFAAGAVPSRTRVLLIDDVATTGSTLLECAAALKAAGTFRVHGLVLAREG